MDLLKNLLKNKKQRNLVLLFLLVVVLGGVFGFVKMLNSEQELPSNWVLFACEPQTASVQNLDKVELYDVENVEQHDEIVAKLQRAKQNKTDVSALAAYPQLHLQHSFKAIQMLHRYDCLIEYADKNKTESLGELLATRNSSTSFVLSNESGKQIIRVVKEYGKYRGFYIVIAGKLYLARPL